MEIRTSTPSGRKCLSRTTTYAKWKQTCVERNELVPCLGRGRKVDGKVCAHTHIHTLPYTHSGKTLQVPKPLHRLSRNGTRKLAKQRPKRASSSVERQKRQRWDSGAAGGGWGFEKRLKLKPTSARRRVQRAPARSGRFVDKDATGAIISSQPQHTK